MGSTPNVMNFKIAVLKYPTYMDTNLIFLIT
jgi:hypothetical protein